MNSNNRLHIDLLEPPETLLSSVLFRVEQEKAKYQKIRIWYCGIISVISFISLIPVVTYLLSDIFNSGFVQYLSIVLSDTSYVLLYWQDFTLLLADSFPAFSTLLIGILFLLMVSSVKFLFVPNRFQLLKFKF